jgi:hypothetical protein
VRQNRPPFSPVESTQPPTYTPVGTPKIWEFFQSAQKNLKPSRIAMSMLLVTNIDLKNCFYIVVVVKSCLERLASGFFYGTNPGCSSPGSRKS